jgi:hypothetical protein
VESIDLVNDNGVAMMLGSQERLKPSACIPD